MRYIAYDIKGIQQFIFSVPKLKYVIGASLLIDEFDRSIRETHPKNTIFTGGGRGILHVESVEVIRQILIEKAAGYGLDLRIGSGEQFSDVVHGADDLHPFVPESLEGEPCRVSGLWPITLEQSKGPNANKGIHPLVWKRHEAVGKRREANSFDQRILNKLTLPEKIAPFRDQVEFFSSVRSEAEDGEPDAGYYGAESLGDRNRWAVVALDGNDMGSQFRAFEQQNGSVDESVKTTWYGRMSRDLDACTREAFYAALSQTIEKWWAEEFNNLDPIISDVPIVLPFRPLILGGDDILCLAHSSYALDLAKTIIDEFSQRSRAKAEAAKKDGISSLWPGTGNRLSISAGIAFTGVTLPLHTSIPYAESLLGSAKGKFRKKEEKKDGEPTPAAIDWEHLTESMLDTPAARRKRDRQFIDEDLDGTEIRLTQKPYKVDDDLERLLKLRGTLKEKKYPRSLRIECQAILSLPWAQRVQRLAAMRKLNRELAEMIQDDFDGKLGTEWSDETTEHGKPVRSTMFCDAVELLEEEHRMEQTTV